MVRSVPSSGVAGKVSRGLGSARDYLLLPTKNT